MNYAEEPEHVALKRKAEKRLRRVIGIAVAISLAVCCMCTGLYVAELANQHAIEDLSRFADPEHVDGNGNNGVQDGDVIGEGALPDWDGIEAETGMPASGWIRVASHDIDFPVVQWFDNEYGLHHDMYGNNSWAGVFLDCDADANGRNRVIYGHTLYGGGMFSGLAQARYQSNFDEIGTIQYATPEAGWQDFVPIAALDVPAEDTSIRTFAFETTIEGFEDAMRTRLLKARTSGEYNVALSSLNDSAVTSQNVKQITSSSALNPDASVEVASGKFYELTEQDIEDCKQQGTVASYRQWLRSMISRADAVSHNAFELVENSESCVVLACCSWPFRNVRTLVIGVR